MAVRSHRTDTAFFITVALILVGGFVWAARQGAATPSNPSTESVESSQPSTEQSAAKSEEPAAPPTWKGELVFVRGKTVVARKVDTTERVIYTAPADLSIVGATPIADDAILLQLSSNPGVFTLKLTNGTTSPFTAVTSVASVAPRPTTNDVVYTEFSNAERDFGTSIILREKGRDHKLYQTKESVTDLAWRSDGDLLAIGTQTGVITLTITSGDAVSTSVGAPVRSLTWSGSDILTVLTDGSVKRITPGKSPEAVSAYSGIGRDILSLDDHTIAWLSGDTGEGEITIAATSTTRASVAKETVTKASIFIGVLNE